MSGNRLEDNCYNRGLGADEAKLKVWKSAGLMLTYGCPGRCACCYVHCGPEAGRAATDMSVATALACWRAVRRLAGERGKVHLTGGEPFERYEVLKGILAEAQAEGLAGLEKVETNAAWGVDEGLVRERLVELDRLGLTVLGVSTDVYHQAYVPMERVERVVRIGREVLGDERVRVRWRDFYERPVLVGEMETGGRNRAYQEELHKRPERMVGRAADELAMLTEGIEYRELAGRHCQRRILGAGHVHVDGAGHVFIGTCAGVMVGRIGEEIDLEGLWREFDYREHEIYSILMTAGPFGLAERSRSWGYEPRSRYASGCHLCYEVRRFLYGAGLFAGRLGPGECYGTVKIDEDNSQNEHKP